MKLSGQQHEILKEAILRAYPDKEKLAFFLLAKMDLRFEQISRGADYEARVFNLIADFEAEGELENLINLLIKDKPKSPFLEKVKSEFKIAIEDDNQISETNNFIAPATDTGICPYKGLRYFDCNEEDSKYFHGRENLTDQLLDKVRQSNFIAIVGPSGSGKSSVMRAGLVHQLKRGEKLAGSGNWKVKILVPEDETERTGAGLAASWLLEQWGEKMPVQTAEVDKQGNVQLRILEKLPPIVIEQLEEGIILEMVQVPGGEFIMGSPEEEEEGNRWERPTHKVKVSPFLIGKYPITREQWRLVATLPKVELDLNPEPSSYKGEGVPESILNRYPVTNFTWYEAVEFCKRLSSWSGEKGKGYQYRLPSEVQWEYACRAGTETPYHWGQKITPNLGNCLEKALGRPTPVGRFQVANAFGLYDVHGNVLEWCEDLWHNTYDGATEDGSAWLNKNDNDYRLLRGGAFYNNSGKCRSAIRSYDHPCNTYNSVGLRVVAVPWT